MILSLLFALLTLGTLAALLLPLMRRRLALPARREHALAIYRDQLAELDREVARGEIPGEAAAAAKLEIERRLLAADREVDFGAAAPATRKWLPLAVAIGAPLLALAVYLPSGRPDLPAMPLAERTGGDPNDRAAAERRRLVEATAEARKQLAARPDDVDLRLDLARLSMIAGDNDAAVATLREGIARASASAPLLSALGEALTHQAGGTVTAPAREALLAAERADRADPRTQYFLGLAEAQAGDSRAALKRWLDLEAASPPDASYLRTLLGEIDRVAKASGIDPSSIRPDRPSARGPSEDDMRRMQQLSPQDREQAIRSMVDGLDARLRDNPDDLPGWLRLANARKVLGETEKAAEAYAQAARLRPDDPRILADWIEVLVRPLRPGTPIPPGTVAALKKLETLNPNHGLTLFYLGQASLEGGDKDGALSRWRKLLTMLPPDAPLRAQLERRIADVAGQ